MEPTPRSRRRSRPHRAGSDPARPRPRSGAAVADPGPDAAAAGPQPAAHLMRPVSQTPTEAADYAVLSSIYGALLGGTALSARGKDPIPRGSCR